MKLSQPNAEIFVPDRLVETEALARTTHLGIGAHPDDLEIMAAHGILSCFGRPDRWFTGVVVSDGAGSARGGAYTHFSDAELARVRRAEQKKAAYLGEYAAQLLLSYPSAAVKNAANAELLSELVQVLQLTSPEVVYTHNLADEHDTHVAVALRVIAACRMLDPAQRPKQLIGCEVWRDLDWLCGPDKVAMPLAGREHLQNALIGVFDSQIEGGKRYDLATSGRRRAHATYSESHETDQHAALIWGMDLSPLMHEGDPLEYVARFVRRFEEDVLARMRRLR